MFRKEKKKRKEKGNTPSKFGDPHPVT